MRAKPRHSSTNESGEHCPDLQSQLGAEYVHPGWSPPVRDVLQSNVSLHYLLLDIEVDLLRLGVKVLVQEGQHESNGSLLLHVRYEPGSLVALLNTLIRVNQVSLKVGSYIN